MFTSKANSHAFLHVNQYLRWCLFEIDMNNPNTWRPNASQVSNLGTPHPASFGHKVWWHSRLGQRHIVVVKTCSMITVVDWVYWDNLTPQIRQDFFTIFDVYGSIGWPLKLDGSWQNVQTTLSSVVPVGHLGLKMSDPSLNIYFIGLLEAKTWTRIPVLFDGKNHGPNRLRLYLKPIRWWCHPIWSYSIVGVCYLYFMVPQNPGDDCGITPNNQRWCYHNSQ